MEDHQGVFCNHLIVKQIAISPAVKQPKAKHINTYISNNYKNRKSYEEKENFVRSMHAHLSKKH